MPRDVILSAASCHSERSEESSAGLGCFASLILRCAQNDLETVSPPPFGDAPERVNRPPRRLWESPGAVKMSVGGVE